MSDRPGEAVPVPATELEAPVPELEWVEPEELEPADDPVGDTIRALNVRYAAALAAADANALCELFAPDGAIIDFEGPDAIGHDGLREMAHYARERFRDMTFEIDVEWVKADPLDSSVAHAAGTWRMAFLPGDGHGAAETLRSHGRFAETWRRATDGRWRIHRDLTLTREDG